MALFRTGGGKKLQEIGTINSATYDASSLPNYQNLTADDFIGVVQTYADAANHISKTDIPFPQLQYNATTGMVSFTAVSSLTVNSFKLYVYI